MRNINFIITCLLLIGTLVIQAQTNIAHRFSANLAQNQVYLDILIRAGNTCQGIYIERSTDSTLFREIGNIPGICGSSERDEPYTFIDEQPQPDAVNYYRVRFGENGYSAVETVRYLRTGAGGYKVFPNPARNKVSILFENENRKAHSFELYSAQGQKLLETPNIKDNTISFSVAGFTPGLYFFRLSNGEQSSISGAFWVL